MSTILCARCGEPLPDDIVAEVWEDRDFIPHGDHLAAWDPTPANFAEARAINARLHGANRKDGTMSLQDDIHLIREDLNYNFDDKGETFAALDRVAAAIDSEPRPEPTTHEGATAHDLAREILNDLAGNGHISRTLERAGDLARLVLRSEALEELPDPFEPVSPARLYAVQDGYGGSTFRIVATDEPIKALDAYAVSQGSAPYSALQGDDAADLLFDRGGMLGAVFANYEIVAVPVREPLHLSVGPAGWAVVDDADVCLTDAHDTAQEAVWFVESSAGRDDIGYVCRDCGKPLDAIDIESTDPARCDSCEQRQRYDDVADAPHALSALQSLLSHDDELLIGSPGEPGLITADELNALRGLRDRLLREVH